MKLIFRMNKITTIVLNLIQIAVMSLFQGKRPERRVIPSWEQGVVVWLHCPGVLQMVVGLESKENKTWKYKCLVVSRSL